MSGCHYYRLKTRLPESNAKHVPRRTGRVTCLPRRRRRQRVRVVLLETRFLSRIYFCTNPCQWIRLGAGRQGPSQLKSEQVPDSVNSSPTKFACALFVKGADIGRCKGFCRAAKSLDTSELITPPLKPVDILPRLWRTLERTRPEDPLTQGLKARLGLQQFVGESQAFLAAIKIIPLIARSDPKQRRIWSAASVVSPK
jgi:hypothetical protein